MDFQRPLLIVIDCGHSIVYMISLIFLYQTNVKRIVIVIVIVLYIDIIMSWDKSHHV